MATLMTIPPTDKVKQLEHLVNLYDVAIAKQTKLLNSVIQGTYQSSKVSDPILFALVKGDLKLMQEEKLKLADDLENIQILSRNISLNGYSSASTDSDNDD